MKLNSNTKIKRNKNIIFKVVDRVVYILDPRNSTVHTLNETASFIWRSLKAGRSIKELGSLITKNYEINEKDAIEDIKTFISQYLKEKLLILDRD